MKILLIGASGRVGSLLVPALRAHEVVPVRRPQVDLRDPDAVERAVREADPEAVILAAGMADADACEDRPGDAYAVNVDGLRRVAEASRGRAFVSFSTDHVFDGRNGPYSEEDAPAPLSVYGRTKLEGERIALTVNRRSLVVRTTLVFAPGDRSFFNRLVAGDALDKEAQALAQSLAQGPSFAHAMTKRMLHHEWAMGLDQAIEAEAVAQAVCMQTQDFRRAYEAFVAKQKPVFAGN